MIEVVKFKAAHLEYIHRTGMSDKKLMPWLLPESGPALEAYGEANGNLFTFLEDNVPVVFGGIAKYWHNRGEAWLVWGKPRKFFSLIKVVKKKIEECPLHRLEMVIDYGSKTHERWAQFLGFRKECGLLKSYLPGGEDASLYVLIREGVSE